MSELNTPKGVSRRTIAKGAAWTVPAIAVAGAAPAMAASPPEEPPPPTFNWGNAVKNPGNSCTQTCIPMQSYGVPVTVSNPTATDVIIRFTDYNLGASPTGVGGTSVGVNNVGVVYGQTLNAAACNNRVASCTLSCGASASNSVCVPAGSTFTFWVFSNNTGSSPQTSQYVPWEWIETDECTIITSDAGYSSTSPPNDAC